MCFQERQVGVLAILFSSWKLFWKRRASNALTLLFFSPDHGNSKTLRLLVVHMDSKNYHISWRYTLVMMLSSLKYSTYCVYKNLRRWRNWLEPTATRHCSVWKETIKKKRVWNQTSFLLLPFWMKICDAPNVPLAWSEHSHGKNSCWRKETEPSSDRLLDACCIFRI